LIVLLELLIWVRKKAEGAARLCEVERGCREVVWCWRESGKEKINYRIAVWVGESECNAAQCFPVLRNRRGMANDGSGGIRQQQRNQAEENKAECVSMQRRRKRKRGEIFGGDDGCVQPRLPCRARFSFFSLLHNWVRSTG
jgi:hypothetical protein